MAIVENSHLMHPVDCDLTVVIPTAGRSAMLRTALASVVQQTALSAIKRVIVIENGDDRASEEVCNSFPTLPLQYVFREPSMPIGYEWFTDTFCRVKTQYTAILFDDDWWMPDHLENAIGAMSGDPGVVASYSSYVTIQEEQGRITGSGDSFLPWFASSCGLSNDRWILNLEDMLVANLVATTGTFMTLLVSTEAWLKCLPCISHGNPYDVDRLLAVELGRYGKVSFTRRPTAYVRQHQSQESKRIEKLGEASGWWQDSTMRLLALARSEPFDVSLAFARRMNEKAVTPELLARHAYAGSLESLVSYGAFPCRPITVKNAEHQIEAPAWGRRMLRSLLPPLSYQIVSKIRSWKK
jgi:hypothetical protein